MGRNRFSRRWLLAQLVLSLRLASLWAARIPSLKTFTLASPLAPNASTVEARSQQGLPRAAASGDRFYFLHIPKCAGGSALFEVEQLVRVSPS